MFEGCKVIERTIPCDAENAGRNSEVGKDRTQSERISQTGSIDHRIPDQGESTLFGVASSGLRIGPEPVLADQNPFGCVAMVARVRILGCETGSIVGTIETPVPIRARAR